MRKLVDAGLDVGVLMAPIVPGISSHPHKLERTVKAIADSGAKSLGATVLHLQDGTRDHFLSYLAREFPHLSERYGELYAGKYAPKDYTSLVAKTVELMKARYMPKAAAREGRRLAPHEEPARR